MIKTQISRSVWLHRSISRFSIRTKGDKILQGKTYHYADSTEKQEKNPPSHQRIQTTEPLSAGASPFTEIPQTRPALRVWAGWQRAARLGGGEPDRRTPESGSDKGITPVSVLRYSVGFMSFSPSADFFFLLFLYLNRMERRVHAARRRSPLCRWRALLTEQR